MIATGADCTNTYAERAVRVSVSTIGRSRHLADDGRHLTDPAVRFAAISSAS
jgi:hypothetical protein